DVAIRPSARAARSMAIAKNREVAFAFDIGSRTYGVAGWARPGPCLATVDLSISQDALGFKFQGGADETHALVRSAVVRNRGRRDCSDLDRSRDIMAGVSYAVAFSPFRYCGCGGIGRQRSHSRSKKGG